MIAQRPISIAPSEAVRTIMYGAVGFHRLLKCASQ
jgi:hypothetical protein